MPIFGSTDILIRSNHMPYAVPIFHSLNNFEVFFYNMNCAVSIDFKWFQSIWYLENKSYEKTRQIVLIWGGTRMYLNKTAPIFFHCTSKSCKKITQKVGLEDQLGGGCERRSGLLVVILDSWVGIWLRFWAWFILVRISCHAGCLANYKPIYFGWYDWNIAWSVNDKPIK